MIIDKRAIFEAISLMLNSLDGTKKEACKDLRMFYTAVKHG